MKVVVDFKKCLNSGECYYNHPTVFQYTEDGLPKILVEEIDTDALRREVEEAIQVCPAQAISLAD